MKILDKIGKRLEEYERKYFHTPHWIRMGFNQFHALCIIKPSCYTSQKLYGIPIFLSWIELIKVK